jgi:competence protein ComEA
MRLLPIAWVVFAMSIASKAAVGQEPQKPDNKPTPQQEEEAFATAAEELTIRVCTTACHGIDRLERLRRTPRDWNDQVRVMAERGAMATEDQFATIKKYLIRYYGLVAVNMATAAELSAVLGFSSKDADAIVAYRDAHGKFADVDALLKVPGIDKARIEEQPDAILFN